MKKPIDHYHEMENINTVKKEDQTGRPRRFHYVMLMRGVVGGL